MHTQYNNTHKITTTIHTANQQQLHTRQLKTSNNTHETNYDGSQYRRIKHFERLELPTTVSMKV